MAAASNVGLKQSTIIKYKKSRNNRNQNVGKRGQHVLCHEYTRDMRAVVYSIPMGAVDILLHQTIREDTHDRAGGHAAHQQTNREHQKRNVRLQQLAGPAQRTHQKQHQPHLRQQEPQQDHLERQHYR